MKPLLKSRKFWYI